MHDIPLLAEGQRAADFKLVIVVDVPPEVQIARLGARGLPEDQARARMAAQATREQRLAIADIVIDNSGTLDELDLRVGAVWTELVARVQGRVLRLGSYRAVGRGWTATGDWARWGVGGGLSCYGRFAAAGVGCPC